MDAVSSDSNRSSTPGFKNGDMLVPKAVATRRRSPPEPETRTAKPVSPLDWITIASLNRVAEQVLRNFSQFFWRLIGKRAPFFSLMVKRLPRKIIKLRPFDQAQK